MNPNATSFDMSFQFNPAAAEFTPSGVAPEATTFAGQPSLNAQAGVFVPNFLPEDASLAQGSSHAQYNSTQGQVTQNMTPHYQWETSQLGNPQQYQQYQQGYAPNGYGAGTGYQEYDHVSYYRGGKYGKAKKKSKKRDMRQVYGYNGSHKRAAGGGASHFQAVQQYYDPADGRWYNANGSLHPRGADKGYMSAQPAGYAAKTLQSRYEDQMKDDDDAAYLQDHHGAAESSAAGVYNSLSSGHGHVHSHSYDANNYSDVSFDQQMSTVDHMRSPSTIIPATATTDFSIPSPSYANANDTISIPAFQSANRQRTSSTSGSTIADSDFVTRFHTGAYASLADTVATLFKDAEATYFPADRSTFEWPKKTEREMEYVTRLQQLSVMGEDELAFVYERVFGGGN